MFSNRILSFARRSCPGNNNEPALDDQEEQNRDYMANNGINPGSSHVIEIRRTETGFSEPTTFLKICESPSFEHGVVTRVDRASRNKDHVKEMMKKRDKPFTFHESGTGEGPYFLIDEDERFWPREFIEKLERAYASSEEKSIISKQNHTRLKKKKVTSSNHDIDVLRYMKCFKDIGKRACGKRKKIWWDKLARSKGLKSITKDIFDSLINNISEEQTQEGIELRCICCGAIRHVSIEFFNKKDPLTFECKHIGGFVSCKTDQLVPITDDAEVSDEMDGLTIEETPPGPDENGRYTVTKILSDRIIKIGKKETGQYLVKWKGYTDPTWEDARRILDDVTETAFDYEKAKKFNL
jgi:hypothetical protein